MTRIVVVGAGPVGLACALMLARSGFDVTVLEAAPGIRERPCGEGMMPPGVGVLEDLGLLGESGGSPFRGIAYYCDGREAVRADFPSHPGAPSLGLGVRRPGLDRLLLGELGRHPRAEIVFGAPVDGLVHDERAVAGVSSGRWRFRGACVVAADGLRSRVRSLLGFDERPLAPARFGLCGHFEWSGSRPPLTHVEVHLVDGGEVYRTPCGPGAEGWIFLSSPERIKSWAGDFASRFRELARSSPPLASAIEGARPEGRFGATGPFGRLARSRWAPGVLLAGDAAGFLDPLTGEGLALGLRGAARAASILAASSGHVGRDEGASYERWWRSTTRDPWLLTRGMLLLARHRGLARRTLSALGRRPDVMSRLLGVACGYFRLFDALRNSVG